MNHFLYFITVACSSVVACTENDAGRHSPQRGSYVASIESISVSISKWLMIPNMYKKYLLEAKAKTIVEDFHTCCKNIVR